MTSDRILSDCDTLGRALREVSALLRAAEVQAALEGLRAAPVLNDAQDDAVRRVRAAALGVRKELDGMLDALPAAGEAGQP